MLAGNSTVHLDALKHGVSTVYLNDIDPESPKILPFLDEGLIESTSISDFRQRSWCAARSATQLLTGRAHFSDYVDLSSSEDQFRHKLGEFLQAEVQCDL